MADQNLHDSNYQEWLRQKQQEEEERRQQEEEETKKKDPKAAAKYAEAVAYAAKCTRTALYGER